MLGELWQREKLFGEDGQHFHCFEMLGQLLGRLTTSPSIVGYDQKMLGQMLGEILDRLTLMLGHLQMLG